MDAPGEGAVVRHLGLALGMPAAQVLAEQSKLALMFEKLSAILGYQWLVSAD
jgi:hypothetical protein